MIIILHDFSALYEHEIDRLRSSPWRSWMRGHQSDGLLPQQRPRVLKQLSSLYILCPNNSFSAVVVAQLVERLLPISDVRGLNPVIGKTLFIYWTFVYCQLCIEKTKIKKKEAGNGPLKKSLKIVAKESVSYVKKLGNARANTHPSRHSVWPEENRQISIKVAQKWFH